MFTVKLSFLERYFGKDFSIDEARILIDKFKNLDNEYDQDLFISALLKKPQYKLNQYAIKRLFGIGEGRYKRIVNGESNGNPSYSVGTIQDLIIFNNFQSTYSFLDESNNLPVNRYKFYLKKWALWYPGGKFPIHPLIMDSTTFYRKLRQIQSGKYTSEIINTDKDKIVAVSTISAPVSPVTTEISSASSAKELLTCVQLRHGDVNENQMQCDHHVDDFGGNDVVVDGETVDLISSGEGIQSERPWCIYSSADGKKVSRSD
jgi:hypothetical protein